MNKKINLLTLLALVAFTLFALGCGDNDSNTGPPGTDSGVVVYADGFPPKTCVTNCTPKPDQGTVADLKVAVDQAQAKKCLPEGPPLWCGPFKESCDDPTKKQGWAADCNTYKCNGNYMPPDNCTWPASTKNKPKQ